MKHLARKLFCISMVTIASLTHPFQITVLKTNQAEEQTWQQLRNMFIDTFCTAYEHLSIKEINSNFATTALFLENLFDTDRTQINDLDFDFIVAVHEQEMLGYILSCYCEKEKTAYIHHLVVDTSKHNKGVGKNLIKACEDMYSKAQFVALSTRTFNHKAIGFYKHVGFYETDCAPEVAYTIRPKARNNQQIVNLEKVIVRDCGGQERMNFGHVIVKRSGIGQFADGLGVYANKDFKKDEVVLKWNLKIVSKQEYNDLSVYEQTNFCHERNGKIYYYPDPERHVNRSLNPNVLSDMEREANIALRDIQKGEELSIAKETREDF